MPVPPQIIYPISAIFSALVSVWNGSKSRSDAREFELQRQEMQKLQMRERRQEVADGQQLQRELAWLNRETQLDLAAKHRQEMRNMANYQKTLENWPLIYGMSEFISPPVGRDHLPLKIILAPPRVSFDCFAKAQIDTLEVRLEHDMRTFLNRYYSFHDLSRPTEFLGGVWQSKRFRAEGAAKVLHKWLPTEPMLIFESDFDDTALHLKVIYWGMEQSKYVYHPVADIPYASLATDLAKERAGNSGEIKPEKKDFTLSFDVLSILQRLFAGLIIDLHHLVHYDVQPVLPQAMVSLLPDLTPVFSSAKLGGMVETIIDDFQNVYAELRHRLPHQFPDVALQMAESVEPLLQGAWSKVYVNQAMKAWLEARQIHLPDESDLLSPTLKALTAADLDYAKRLALMLKRLGDERFGLIEAALVELREAAEAEPLTKQVVPAARIARRVSRPHRLQAESDNDFELEVAPSQPDTQSDSSDDDFVI